MLTRSGPILAVLACQWCAFATAYGQKVEEDDVQILKPITSPREPTRNANLAEAARQVLKLTNEFRKEEERDKAEINPQLAKAAQAFADYMARTSRYGHKADGSTPADRAQKAGYKYCIIAENIAYAYDSGGFTTDGLANELFGGWKVSPGHRQNMLDPDVTEIGIAIAQGADHGYVFAVQMIGRPRSKTLEFEITNESQTTVEYRMGDETFSLAPGHGRTHQVCRPRDLVFQWPDAEGKEHLVQPKNGDHFVVVQDGETLELRKKKAQKQAQ
jgi:uncharacterized protein YkwD